MSITVTVYNHIPRRLIDHTIDLANATLRMRLVTSGYIPDADHTLIGDLGGHEVDDLSYSAQNVTTVGINQDNITGTTVTYSALSAEFRYIVLTADDTTNDWLLCYYDLGADVVIDGADYTPSFSSGVIFDLERAV